ncbi:MAG: YaeQ family protein [Gammaproteobacteria bacterium]|nr:YaeQ family protein [Pseudomonadales bacterium]MCP5349313.1 YaeQ family protein [Pseudomonadales bacterium]
MALKPTIYKFKVDLSHLDRQVYETLNLTLARHPSETAERMLVRLLAFCFNARERLEFCKGLSNPEQPDLWQLGLTGNPELWIEVGEPATERIRKATRLAPFVVVYCFNSKGISD